MVEGGLSRGRICFTLEELMKLIFTLQKEAFTGDIPIEGQKIGAGMLYVPGTRTRKGLDDEFLQRVQQFMDADPFEERIEEATKLVEYAIQRQPHTSSGRKIYDTGALITVTGQTLQMAGVGIPQWAIPVGEFLETIGALTAIVGGVWMSVEEIFNIDPGYIEKRIEL